MILQYLMTIMARDRNDSDSILHEFNQLLISLDIKGSDTLILTPFLFVIMMAGPSVPGHETLDYQKVWILQESGMDKKEIEKNMKAHKKFYEVIRNGKGWDKIRKEVRQQMEKRFPVKASNYEKLVETNTDSYMDYLRSIWMRYFIDYDPKISLT